MYFNSHAHVERDFLLSSTFTILVISTHTLTWSVTSRSETNQRTLWFQLTRSRGAWRQWKTVYSKYVTFQLTRSRGAWLFYSASLQTILHFNSHAHVERDRLTTPKNSVTIISTHTLTWSVTTWEKKEAWHKIFQLTRSRGAWLRCTSLSDLHELFQLTRSRGAWPYFFICGKIGMKFQLTRSRGAWPQSRMIWADVWAFQLTRSRGAWRVILVSLSL